MTDVTIIENWGREFEKFAPELNIQTYYGTQNERVYQRAELNKTVGEWDVCITTYNLAQGNEHDRKFFKKIEWEVWSCGASVVDIALFT